MIDPLNALRNAAHTDGIPELPDHGPGEGRAKEDAELADARSCTNVHELPAADTPEGEVRADEDLDASIERAREDLRARDRRLEGELQPVVPVLHDPLHDLEKLG